MSEQTMLRRGSTEPSHGIEISTDRDSEGNHKVNDRVFSHAHAQKLDDPERLKILPPTEIVSALKLREGTRVADIGAGTGYFALPVSKVVGDTGHVYAIDLQPEMLSRLKEKVEASGALNVSLHQGDASRVPLPDTSCDFILFANIWHEFSEHDSVIREARRLLVPGGRVAVLDWRAELDSPPGPPKHHRVSAESVSKFLLQHGFSIDSNQHIGTSSHLVIATAAQ